VALKKVYQLLFVIPAEAGIQAFFGWWGDAHGSAATPNLSLVDVSAETPPVKAAEARRVNVHSRARVYASLRSKDH